MKLLSPIATFMIASAGIHTAMVISSDPGEIMLPASTGSIISIQLEHKKNSPFEPKEKTEIKQNKNNIKNNSHLIKKTQNTLQNNIINSIEQRKSRAHVTSILIEEFKQYFSYPEIAVKRNWQGKVLLSLRVSSSGKIKDIQIKNSSGYDILDQAAIDSMYKVKTLPEMSSWLKNDIELKLPIIYKLTES